MNYIHLHDTPWRHHDLLVQLFVSDVPFTIAIYATSWHPDAPRIFLGGGGSGVVPAQG